MRKQEKQYLRAGSFLLVLFALWTVLVQRVDVHPMGQTGTAVGFAALNGWVHGMTGVHLWLYTLTDWLGLIPVFVCLLFGAVGAVQLFTRKDLRKVDLDILLLGVYYVLVVVCYLVFEQVPINYRPILIEGRMEASYPSSTTLLVLSVMPTLVLQGRRRLTSRTVQRWVTGCSMVFSVFMVVGRLISGVHWLTDIVGSVLFSMGLFCLYRAAIKERECSGGIP